MLQWLANAYNSVTGTIDRNVQNWVHNIISTFYAFLHTIFGNVANGWEDFTKAVTILRTGINDLGTWTHYMLHRIWKVWIPEFAQYVTKNILQPLLGAIRWISTEGILMLSYFQHPSKLVDLIFDFLIAKLENTAAVTAERLGKFFVALFVKNVGLLLRIIEDIIDAAL